MSRFTEWDVDDALHILFGHNSQFMLVFQDPDLHVYTDRHLIPMTMMKRGSTKKLTRRFAETLRGRHISVNPQQFRPDAVLVDRVACPYVLEAKLGRINSEADCAALVVQALVYADLIISPRWKPRLPAPNTLPSTTYDLLEDLHEAHWFLKVLDEGRYRPLEERHQHHFRLDARLNSTAFDKTPDVLFLLEKFNDVRLAQACKRVQELDFEEYRRYAESVLPQRLAFRKHLASLGSNWLRLRKMLFSSMQLDVAKLQGVIEHKPVSVIQHL